MSDKLVLLLGGTSISTQAELDAALKAHTDSAVKAAVDATKIEAFESGKKAGAEGELKRIQAVEAQLMPGHEKLVAELKFDGKTTGPEAAEKVLAAERKALGDRATALRADAPDPAKSSTPDPTKEAEAEKNKNSSSASKTPEADAAALAEKIDAYMIDQKKLGKNVSYAQALAAVTAKK